MSSSPRRRPLAAFGPNEWLVDELYQQYLKDKNSVDPAWWDFFEDYQPGEARANGNGHGDRAPSHARPPAPAPAQPRRDAGPARPLSPPRRPPRRAARRRAAQRAATPAPQPAEPATTAPEGQPRRRRGRRTPIAP